MITTQLVIGGYLLSLLLLNILIYSMLSIMKYQPQQSMNNALPAPPIQSLEFARGRSETDSNENVKFFDNA